VDGVPAVAFLVVLLATRDFRLATWVVVGGAVFALVASLLVERRIAPLPAITGALALGFGIWSLVMHDPRILQMKMTIVDGLLGAALFGGVLIGRNPLKMILGGAFDMPEHAWRMLAIRYGLFWWLCAIANEIVRHTQSQQTWAWFRTAVMVAAAVFAVAQTPFILKHARTPQPHPTPEPPDPGF
jgi:intracellular septation protein